MKGNIYFVPNYKREHQQRYNSKAKNTSRRTNKHFKERRSRRDKDWDEFKKIEEVCELTYTDWFKKILSINIWMI